MSRLILLLCVLLFGFNTTQANDPGDSTGIREALFQKFKDSINASLHYQSGLVDLPGSGAKLKLPAKFKFLDAKQSHYILEDLWGNLPDDEMLGTIFPVDSDPFNEETYVYIVSYQDVGFVKDDDVEDINYDDIMKDMKKDDIEDNKRRAEAGLGTLNIIGWAAKPFYDKQNNTLHWAKNLKAEGSDENTLNYTVMLLGRKGILTLNAVAPLSQLSVVQASVPEILKTPEFSDGNAYKDFDSGVDKVAAWTIGGLVAGKVLAKAGLLVLLLKFWKLILIGFVAIGGFITKFFKRKKKNEAWPEDDYASTIQPVDETIPAINTQAVLEAEGNNLETAETSVTFAEPQPGSSPDQPGDDKKNDGNAVEQDHPLK